MTSYKELTKLPIKELQSQVNEAKKELMNLRFQRSTAQLEVTHTFRKTKRHIARLKTAINASERSS